MARKMYRRSTAVGMSTSRSPAGARTACSTRQRSLSLVLVPLAAAELHGRLLAGLAGAGVARQRARVLAAIEQARTRLAARPRARRAPPQRRRRPAAVTARRQRLKRSKSKI